MAKRVKKGPAKKAPKARRATAKAEATEAGRIPLKRICQELGLDPKRSRVKLRRVWRRDENPGVQFHEKGQRWDLTPREAKEVRAILSA